METPAIPLAHGSLRFFEALKSGNATETPQFNSAYITQVVISASLWIIVGAVITAVQLSLILFHRFLPKKKNLSCKYEESLVLVVRIVLLVTVSLVIANLTNVVETIDVVIQNGMAEFEVMYGVVRMNVELVIWAVNRVGKVNIEGMFDDEMYQHIVKAAIQMVKVKVPNLKPLRGELVRVYARIGSVVENGRMGVRGVYGVMVAVMMIWGGILWLISGKVGRKSKLWKSRKRFMVGVGVAVLFTFVSYIVIAAASVIGIILSDMCRIVDKCHHHINNIEARQQSTITEENFLVKNIPCFDFQSRSITQEKLLNTFAESPIALNLTKILLNATLDDTRNFIAWAESEIAPFLKCEKQKSIAEKLLVTICGRKGLVKAVFGWWWAVMIAVLEATAVIGMGVVKMGNFEDEDSVGFE